MIRRIVKINEERCSGCGLCAEACHEGAIGMVDGKAKLLRDDYCDGLGDCLPACPADAISFEEREALPYDHEAVAAAMAARKQAAEPARSCPGGECKSVESSAGEGAAKLPGRLGHWPVQIKLLPVNAKFFDDAHILIAADCSAYAYGNFHEDFIKGRAVLIGCPKLDNYDYSEKLAAIFAANNVRSVTLARMFVPCCGGMEAAVKKALQSCGKNIPLRIVTIGADGAILKDVHI